MEIKKKIETNWIDSLKLQKTKKFAKMKEKYEQEQGDDDIDI